MRPKLFGSVPDHRVLVTGCPRSGTTFVGTVLAFPRSVDYFHEPLNPDCGLPGVVRRYIDLDDPVHADAASQLEELLSYRPLLRGATYAPDRLPRRAAKRVVGGRGPAHLSVRRASIPGRVTSSSKIRSPFGRSVGSSRKASTWSPSSDTRQPSQRRIDAVAGEPCTASMDDRPTQDEGRGPRVQTTRRQISRPRRHTGRTSLAISSTIRESGRSCTSD